MINKEHIIKRFISYVTIDTESDPNNPEFPSTEKQWDLANLLVKELTNIGMKDITLDENCYVMATLPSNLDYVVPTIGFVSHIDTTPDFTGANVNPKIHHQYDGKDIILNENESTYIPIGVVHSLENQGNQPLELIEVQSGSYLGEDDIVRLRDIYGRAN